MLCARVTLPIDEWQRYVEVMRAHRAADERLFERLREFVGDGLIPPRGLSESKIAAWTDLIAALKARRVATERPWQPTWRVGASDPAESSVSSRHR